MSAHPVIYAFNHPAYLTGNEVMPDKQKDVAESPTHSHLAGIYHFQGNFGG